MKTISLLTLPIVLSTVLAPASDWPNWRGPDHDGISRETGWISQWPDAGPKVLWDASVGIGFSSFAVADGRVFTMGNTDNEDSVVCLDAANGKVIWRHTYAEPLAPKLYEGGPNATPTVDGDHVFTMSRSGKIFCVEAKTGKVIWSRDLMTFGLEKPGKNHWGLSGSPLVQGNLVIFNAGRAGMAFKKDSGELVWETGKEPAAYATPVPYVHNGHRSVLVFAGKALVALDVSTGKERWQYPWETSYDVNAADPVVQGDRIFISSGYNHGGAVIKVADDQPELVWENKNMRCQLSGGLLWKGHVYGIDENRLRCIDFETGEVRWTENASGKGSVIMADEKLIVLSEKGELMVAPASAQEFKPTSRVQVLGGKCWTIPVLANGHIYARNAKGNVVCLDVRKR